MPSIIQVDQIVNSAGTGSPTFPFGFSVVYASANNVSGQSIPTSSGTFVTNWTTELDPGSIFTAATGTIVIPSPHVYLIGYYATFQATSGLNAVSSSLILNNSTTLASGIYSGPSSTEPQTSIVLGLFSLSTGNTINFQIAQSSGSSQSLVDVNASFNRLFIMSVA